ncbi:MAG: GTPase [Candidatus Diapherotrites archaeon]|uniref:GTPase n=1 Tax=Candidatus Iainarchaeum sp. TaxID=3101447 RepID=A0A2D6LQ85_9ARCH|nr:GTPase [Candidatus Diapherotrites archaeon]|tara:strand:- start:1272 stop:2021 length:750 start_codon:yes stop_codon:yes gene_type:complete
MKKGFLKIVKKVIDEADILLEVIDSRFPTKSRNAELERIIKLSGKKLLLVLNKSDLVSEENVKKQKELIGVKSVFVSAKKKQGTIKLREAIGKLSGKNEVKVGVVGYPNTGKSSVINMLKGKKSSGVGAIAGFTKGMQYVRISSKVMLIDSPGVIPLEEKDELLMVLLSAKNIQSLEDLEGTGIEVANELLKSNPEKLESFYGINAKDGEDFLEKLAFKRKKLAKGGTPNMNEAARILIIDFQRGKIVL